MKVNIYREKFYCRNILGKINLYYHVWHDVVVDLLIMSDSAIFLFCPMTLWIYKYYARVSKINKMPPSSWWMINDRTRIRVILQFDSCCFILIFNDFPVFLMYEKSVIARKFVHSNGCLENNSLVWLKIIKIAFVLLFYNIERLLQLHNIYL